MKNNIFLVGLLLAAFSGCVFASEVYDQDNGLSGLSGSQNLYPVCFLIHVAGNQTEFNVTRMYCNSGSEISACGLFDPSTGDELVGGEVTDGQNCSLNYQVANDSYVYGCFGGPGTDAYTSGASYPYTFSQSEVIFETNCASYTDPMNWGSCGNLTSYVQTWEGYDLTYNEVEETTTTEQTTTTTISSTTTTIPQVIYIQDTGQTGDSTQPSANVNCQQFRVLTNESEDNFQINATRIFSFACSNLGSCGLYNESSLYQLTSGAFSENDCSINYQVHNDTDYLLCVWGGTTDCYQQATYPYTMTQSQDVKETNCLAGNPLTDCGSTTAYMQSVKGWDLTFNELTITTETTTTTSTTTTISTTTTSTTTSSTTTTVTTTTTTTTIETTTTTTTTTTIPTTPSFLYVQDTGQNGDSTQPSANVNCQQFRVLTNESEGNFQINATRIFSFTCSNLGNCGIYNESSHYQLTSGTFSENNCSINYQVHNNTDYLLCVWGGTTDCYQQTTYPYTMTQSQDIKETNCLAGNPLTDCGSTTAYMQSVKGWDLTFNPLTTTTSTTSTTSTTTTSTTSTTTTTTPCDFGSPCNACLDWVTINSTQGNLTVRDGDANGKYDMVCCSGTVSNYTIY